MTESEPFPVLIAGAGPTGLYLALSLLRNGVRVRILEKETHFHVGSRGTGVQPRTEELMHFLGVLPEVKRLGNAPAPMRSYKLPEGTDVLNTWSILEDIKATAAFPYVKGVSISQAVHEGIIRAELEKYGCFIELGKEVQSFTQDADGVTVKLLVHSLDGGSDQEETVRAEFLAGADGAKGVTRKQLGLTFLGNTEDADGIMVCDTVVRGLGDDYWHVFREDGVIMFFIRALDKSRNLFNIIVAGFHFDPSEFAQPGGMMKLFRQHITRSDIEIEDPQWQSYFRPNMRMVNKFSQGRVFVLGDAAHVHSPTGGQGMNSSIQDAFNLGWKLALVHKRLAPVSLLNTYNEERLPVIAEMLQKTTGLYKKTGDPNDDPATGSLFRGKELFMLGINYRWSPIVLDTRTPTDGQDLQARAYGGYGDSLLAGDRAPDAPDLMTPQTGAETSLFDIFDPALHTVVILKSAAAADTLTPVLDTLAAYPDGTIQTVVISRRPLDIPFTADYMLTDTKGHAFANYRVEGDDLTIVVVRPDSYIGAIVTSSEGVEAYFAKIFFAERVQLGHGLGN